MANGFSPKHLRKTHGGSHGGDFLWLHGAGARGFSGLSKVAHNLVGAAPSNSWMDALLLPQPGGAVPDTPS